MIHGDLSNSPCEEDIKDAMERQSLTGDKNFELGWWTSAWRELHEKMRASGIRSKYSGDKWAPRAQKIVWGYVSSHWRLRNKMVNGADDQEEQRVARLRLNQLVRETYASRPAVG